MIEKKFLELLYNKYNIPKNLNELFPNLNIELDKEFFDILEENGDDLIYSIFSLITDMKLIVLDYTINPKEVELEIEPGCIASKVELEEYISLIENLGWTIIDKDSLYDPESFKYGIIHRIDSFLYDSDFEDVNKVFNYVKEL